MKPIPISAAKRIADEFGYQQVVIIARAVGEGEHVTTYGKDAKHCKVAADIGDFLKYKVMGWAKEYGLK
jgi:molybdopterin biosynthesis enzyme